MATPTTPEPIGERPGAGAPVRVGRIEFVNCFPLYHHFTEELTKRAVAADVVAGYPAELNRRLVGGEIDVALPSSIAFARDADDLVLLPDVSISSFGAVDSIQLFARTPLARIRRVALTEKSATSICLLKVLCREWGIEPEFAPREGPLSEVLEDFDALLLIGDEALHLLRVEAYPHHFDLGAEWRSVTGLPMVYAVCAARRDFVRARPDAAAAVGAALLARPNAAAAVGAALLASRDACAAAPEETAAAAAQVYDFSRDYLAAYFDKLKFGFSPEYAAGLQEFYRRAVAIGDLDRVPDLRAATFTPPAASGSVTASDASGGDGASGGAGAGGSPS